MILVIKHYQDKDYYNSFGQVTSPKGWYVSHGIDTNTGKTIILPSERWQDFSHNCELIDGEWYIK